MRLECEQLSTPFSRLAISQVVKNRMHPTGGAKPWEIKKLGAAALKLRDLPAPQSWEYNSITPIGIRLIICINK